MVQQLLQKLSEIHRLSQEEWLQLLRGHSPESAAAAASLAVSLREPIYGRKVFIRGLVEISNICRNDCLYCGIRRSNQNVSRFRLDADDILLCCERGYEIGFRTFVMQGGEDAFYSDAFLCPLIREIKRRHPDCAVTLSLGERSAESYRLLKAAGANRYLLRHETATEDHYRRLHPTGMSFSHRMQCLRDLKAAGFQTGAGFMVGSPYQTPEHLAADFCFLQDFLPEMIGIGPFIPHHDTPFAGQPAGSAELTLYLLSLIRIMHPRVLLPATTALNTLLSNGAERGMNAGANVIMPNLSPQNCRGKYLLYDNKAYTGIESAEGLKKLRERMSAAGYEIVVDRGDYLSN